MTRFILPVVGRFDAVFEVDEATLTWPWASGSVAGGKRSHLDMLNMDSVDLTSGIARGLPSRL